MEFDPRSAADIESMAWYEEWFDRDEYEVVYQNRNDQEAGHLIDLIERTVAPRPGAHILDVACGRGRHALILARRGYRVVGIDLSARAIERARRRAADAGVEVEFVRSDMRTPFCDACFDGAVNLFTAFGYFEREEDHARAIGAMGASLRPCGWLVQDFLNASYVRDRLVPCDVRQEGGVQITQRRWIEHGRVNKEILLRRNGSTQTFFESVRLFTRDELEALYAAAGLRISRSFGTYDGAPYSPESPRLILVAYREGR
jgi:SAM-dependent methyltransferase